MLPVPAVPSASSIAESKAVAVLLWLQALQAFSVRCYSISPADLLYVGQWRIRAPRSHVELTHRC